MRVAIVVCAAPAATISVCAARRVAFQALVGLQRVARALVPPDGHLDRLRTHFERITTHTLGARARKMTTR